MTEPAREGDTMPDIAMETPDGGSAKPSDYRGRKLVIFFYPKDNTPGCTTEAKEFSAAIRVREGGCAIPRQQGSPQKHRNFIEKHDLTVDLATDAPEAACPRSVLDEKQMYGKTFMGMVRTTYLVAEDGTIARVWNKVRVKGHVDEVLAAAREA